MSVNGPASDIDFMGRALELAAQAADRQEVPVGAVVVKDGRIIGEGFFVGATNPKGVIIFTAVLPQFIERSRGDVQAQLLLLGAISIAIGLLSDGAWAIASGTARTWLGRSQRRLEQLSVAGGMTLIGLGAALAVTGRRQ